MRSSLLTILALLQFEHIAAQTAQNSTAKAEEEECISYDEEGNAISAIVETPSQCSSWCIQNDNCDKPFYYEENYFYEGSKPTCGSQLLQRACDEDRSYYVVLSFLAVMLSAIAVAN